MTEANTLCALSAGRVDAGRLHRGPGMAIVIGNDGSSWRRHPGGTHRGRGAQPHPDNQRRRGRRTPDAGMARGAIDRGALSDMELADRAFLGNRTGAFWYSNSIHPPRAGSGTIPLMLELLDRKSVV